MRQQLSSQFNQKDERKRKQNGKTGEPYLAGLFINVMLFLACHFNNSIQLNSTRLTTQDPSILIVYKIFNDNNEY